MSPEQATGDRGIDGRTDIYSLAAMLYEMLAGEPPHLGTSSQAIIAKLMTESPCPVTVLRPSVPPHVSAAVLHALQKLPADRFATAKEFAVALRTPGAVTVASLAVAGWALTRPTAEPPVVRVGLAFPDSLAPAATSQFALSPDGQRMAYIVRSPTGNRIMLKERDRAAPTPIEGSSGGVTLAASLAFSPDGRRVAFVEDGKLKTVAITGGTPTVLLDTVASTRGIAWLADGML